MREYDVKERVARGIALLDGNAPADWRERVDWDRLILVNTIDCVLGQIYGEAYMRSPQTVHKLLGTDAVNESNYGFCGFGEMETEWRRQVGVLEG